MNEIPLRIIKAMKGLQDWCYSVKCSKCPNCKTCILGDSLYSRSDYQLITDADVRRAEDRERQMSLWG